MPTGFDPVGFFKGVNKGYATGTESKYLGRYGATAKAGDKAYEDKLAREAANNSTTINPPATSGSMSSKFTDTAFRNFRMGERENLKIAPPPQIKPSSTYKASPSTPLNNVIKPRGR
jgi:hypothetical protein